MWKIQQAMQDDAIRSARIHPSFIPVTGLKCSYGKISSPLTENPVGKTAISGTEPARSLTSKILQRNQKRGEIPENGPARSTGLM